MEDEGAVGPLQGHSLGQGGGVGQTELPEFPRGQVVGPRVKKLDHLEETGGGMRFRVDEFRGLEFRVSGFLVEDQGSEVG